MDFKRIFKRGKQKKAGNDSRGNLSKTNRPSSASSTGHASPGPGSPIARSAPVFQPVVSLPGSPSREDKQAKATEVNDDSWTNLAAFLNLLNHTPASVFSPLAAAIDNLNWFVREHERVITAREGYNTLRTELEGLFEDLYGHFSTSTSTTMTTSVLNLCEAIQSELVQVYGTQDRNMISRYMQANDDLEKIMGCYRRIHGHLGRVMLNASLHVWRIVDKQAVETQLRNLSPSMSACYDSAEANVVQRRECAPKTREQVLVDLNAWKDKPDGEKVCWINGMAGTGKTTIATTICSTLDKTHQLGASFFCARSIPACRNVNLIIPTIAYQLARFSGPFRGGLLQVLDRDPDVHTKVPRVQFKRMILEPLREVIHSLPSNIVVVVDALDECEDGGGAEQILEVLLECTSKLPIKFLVSSRPERHIRERIYQSRLQTKLVLHELDERMVKADIETYLHTELASIATPPTESQLATLVERAGALFIYAATVVRYIKRGGTAERLAAVLNMTDIGQESSNKTKEIDRLYETVLIAAFDNEDLEQFEKNRIELVLRTVVCAQEPLTVDALGGLLKLERSQVTDALRPLWSVLHVSESDTTHRVNTLHASFSDYIFDSNRSKRFTCDAQMHNGKIFELCFGRIRRNQSQFNICHLRSSFKFDKDVPHLDDRVKQEIPLDLLYACQYWATHLSLGGKSSQRAEALNELLSQRLLLWIEILNLTKRVNKGVEQMEKATSWLQDSGDRGSESTLLPLARDARRFVTMFATSPVSRSTPHLYVSMLASWPDYQPISHCYVRQTIGLVKMGGIETTERQLSLLSLIPAGSEIKSVAFSPKGSLFAAGTTGSVIQIWDAVSCRMTIDPIKGHTSSVRAIAVSLDGTQICSGSKDGTLRIWDPLSGRLIAGPLEGHTSWVMAVDYSPDGSLLASGSGDGTVRIWSTADWQMKGDPRDAQDGFVFSVAFSPNGSVVAAGSRSLIHFWDVLSGGITFNPLGGHSGWVNTLAFTPDGKYLISGSGDCTIRVWNASSGQMVFGPFQEHLSGIDSVTISPNGNLLVSAAQDNTIQIWDTTTWRARSLLRHTGIARSVRFSPDGSRLVSGSADGNLRVWELPDIANRQKTDGQLHGHNGWVTSVAFSPCGTYIVSGSSDMTVCVWNLQTGRLELSPLEENKNAVIVVGASADGNQIFSVSSDRMVHVWGRHSGQLEHVIGPVETDGDYDDWYQETWPAAFKFDGKRVICGSRSGRIYMWEENKLSYELTGHSSVVCSITFSADGTLFASGSNDGELIIWDASSGEMLLGPFKAHSDYVYSILFSSDSSLVVSGSQDATVRLWSTNDGSSIGDPLRGHTAGISSLAFSPDGSYLLSGSADRTIRLWDLAGRQLIATLKGHTDQVRSVAFSPNGAQIVSGSADMTVRLWSVSALTRTSPHGASDNPPGNPADRLGDNIVSDWEMDNDGWLHDNQGRLLLWVPPDLRSALLRPRNTMIISRQGCIAPEFFHSRIGDQWEMCYQSFPPAFDK